MGSIKCYVCYSKILKFIDFIFYGFGEDFEVVRVEIGNTVVLDCGRVRFG